MQQIRPTVLILQTGSAPAAVRTQLGDFSDWFCLALKGLAAQVKVVRVAEGESLPSPDPSWVTVITGSAAMVTDRHEWSERTAEWIRTAMKLEVPLFGVCYGHQLMADALGGRVDYLDTGREIGRHTIHLHPMATTDPWLKGCPAAFDAYLTHEQTVTQLPVGAIALGYSSADAHQIIRYGSRAVSTQFHPEFSIAAMAAMIRHRAKVLRDEGVSVEVLLGDLKEAPVAAGLLERFVGLQSAPSLCPESYANRCSPS